MNVKFVCRLFVSGLGLLSLLAWTNPFDLEGIIDSHLDEQEEIIRERIPTVVTIVNPVYTPAVRSYLNTYIYRRPEQTSVMLGWAAYYFPKFEQALSDEGLPLDLKYLAIVESALNPNAISRSGAGGLWQFMKPTAKECGLKCGTYIDERMDPEKSTRAAAIYLKQLYTMFGNWELVMAAYNAGPGRVRSAVKRAGTTDFWKLARYLPAETQAYVPGFIAASYIMNFHNEHDLIAFYPEHACGELKTITIYEGMSISELATRSGLSVDVVKALNPTFVKNYIPASKSGYEIWLPNTSADLFNSGKIVVPRNVIAATPENAKATTVTIGDKLYNIVVTKKYHTVRSGDNLYTLAQRYNCTVSELMGWNKLGSSRIAVGQRLEIRQESRELVPELIVEAPIVEERNDQALMTVPSLGLEELQKTKTYTSVSFDIAPFVPEETSEILVLKRRQSLRQALGSIQINSNIPVSQVIMPGTALTGDVVRVKSRA
jgi:membrane-bound lytic murein transglycosylase D